MQLDNFPRVPHGFPDLCVKFTLAVLQIPSQKVFESQTIAPSTVSEGVWSPRVGMGVYNILFAAGQPM